MEAFQYKPLQPGGFRFSRVLSDEGTVLELEHARLDSAPKYIALSYTWGPAFIRNGRSPSATYSITLDGFAFPVEEKLHDALTHLGFLVRGKGCLFWIDAICINQADLDERSLQVSQMTHLYERAYTVFGWLGLPRDVDEARLAVQTMKMCRQRLDEVADVNNSQCVSASSRRISENYNDIFPKPGTDRHRAWFGFKDMLSDRPYWRRSWIYKEATRQTPTYYFCGCSFFDKNDLRATVVVSEHISHFTDLHSDMCWQIIHSSAVALNLFREPTGRYDRGAALLTLLHLTRPTCCTNPRDRVYAVRGMADDLGPNDILPDYSKSIEATYTDVVRFSLSQSAHGLDIFGFVMFPSTDSRIDNAHARWTKIAKLVTGLGGLAGDRAIPQEL